jgi:hypothetical protein
MSMNRIILISTADLWQRPVNTRPTPIQTNIVIINCRVTSAVNSGERRI